MRGNTNLQHNPFSVDHIDHRAFVAQPSYPGCFVGTFNSRAARFFHVVVARARKATTRKNREWTQHIGECGTVGFAVAFRVMSERNAVQRTNHDESADSMSPVIRTRSGCSETACSTRLRTRAGVIHMPM